MSTKDPLTQPISIHIPPNLNHLAIPLDQFLASKPQTALAVGACIFKNFINSNKEKKAHLLLIQRSPTERAFPNKWEIPGGGSEHSDPTILHSVAREVFEETGLHLTRFVRQVGPGYEFPIKSLRSAGMCLKLTFEIEVVEIRQEGGEGSLCHSGDSGAGGAVMDGDEEGEKENDRGIKPPLNIELNPHEHQAYRWVSLEDIIGSSDPPSDPKEDIKTVNESKTNAEQSSNPFSLATEQLKEVLIQAFEEHDKGKAAI